MLQKMWYFPVALGSEGTQKTKAKQQQQQH